MKIFANRSTAALVATLALFSLPAARILGQTATTTPVGYLQTQCLANSDTLVAPPFNRPAALTASVSSVAGNVVTLNASSLTTNQFVYNPSGSPAVTDNFYLIVGPTTNSLTGTLSVTQSSTTVTGSGTAFTTQLAVGNRLTFNDGSNQLTYLVAAIASATSLTLDRAFVDSTATTTTGLAGIYDNSPYEGRWYTVTANGTSTVTVNLNGDTLSSVASGTQVSVIPFWSLNTIYPASAAGVSFTPTTNLHSLNTKILIPNFAGSGINLSPSAIYFYANIGTNVGWRMVGDVSTTDHGNDPVLPDGYFIVSNIDAATSLPLTVVGSVPVNNLVTSLDSNATAAQDNALGLNRPVGVALGSLGLTPANGSFVATTNPHSVADKLFLYDNTLVAHAKSASSIYFYYNSDWRMVGDAITNSHAADIIPAGSAITVEKVAAQGAPTSFWTNVPNY
jgi:uncharacterized protein (TIGR02597 family)